MSKGACAIELRGPASGITLTDELVGKTAFGLLGQESRWCGLVATGSPPGLAADP